MAKVRDRIVNFVESNGKEFTVEGLANRLDISKQSVYNICNSLSDAGALSFRKDGRLKIFRKVDGVVIEKPVEKSIEPIDYIEPASIVPTVEPLIIPVQDQMDMIAHIAGMVIDGTAPSFLLTGMAGVGKTFEILKALQARGLKRGEDYKWISGKAAPMGVYRSLHDNRNSKIIFDDCDDVIKTKGCDGILKSVLDLKKVRTVSWPSKAIDDAGLEESFEFTGGIIFISNLPFTSIGGALSSRSFKVDVFLTPDQVIEKIKLIIHDIEPNGVPMDMEFKEDALETLIEIKDEVLALGKPLDLRAFEKACLLRESAEETGNWGRIRKMVKYQI